MENREGRSQTSNTGKENIRVIDRKGTGTGVRYGRSVKMRRSIIIVFTQSTEWKKWEWGRGGDRYHFTIIMVITSSGFILFPPPLSEGVICINLFLFFLAEPLNKAFNP